MKVLELLAHISNDATIIFSHLDAQNIGYEFIANDVPMVVRNQTVCEISVEDNRLSVVVC